ncbi:MAG: Mur ligase family protein [Planctomycetota bacterium]
MRDAVQRTLITPAAAFRDRRVLIVGLGRFGGGVGVTQWLVGQGARVTVTDIASAESLAESLGEFCGLNVTLELGGHETVDPGAFDLVVVNPAVNKRTSEFHARIVRSGVPRTTEMNLFCERCTATVVGVTGTYGKSTTCAMLAHALQYAVMNQAAPFTAVHLGGNIGRSLLGELDAIRPSDVVVLEVSNAQLEDFPAITWRPQVAAITNLHPHHLDRYESFDEYAQAKLHLIGDSSRSTPVIVGELHPRAEELLRQAVGHHPGRIIRVKSPAAPMRLKVPGRHNHVNAACALTIGETLGLAESLVRDALPSFSGLSHRLEYVRTVDGVTYVNDSKSTAPAATVIAVEAVMEEWEQPGRDHAEPRASSRADSIPPSEPRAAPLDAKCQGSARVDSSLQPARQAFAKTTAGASGSNGRRIVAIVGGQRKDVPLGECAGMLVRSCRAVVGMAESGRAFTDAVREAGGTADVLLAYEPDLPAALRRARSAARPGDVILFSPGAPSFDQYVNFTARGRHFVELVGAASTAPSASHAAGA